MTITSKVGEPYLRFIQAKKNELLAEAEKYENLAQKARAEASDYEAAERVWIKISGDPSLTQGNPTPIAHSAARMPTSSDSLHVKPNHIPPVPLMIIEALEGARSIGSPGLTPAALLSYVRQRYWPEAKNADVGSTAWRMWKDGRLTKPNPDSPIYSLPDIIGGEIEAPRSLS